MGEAVEIATTPWERLMPTTAETPSKWIAWACNLDHEGINGAELLAISLDPEGWANSRSDDPIINDQRLVDYKRLMQAMNNDIQHGKVHGYSDGTLSASGFIAWAWSKNWTLPNELLQLIKPSQPYVSPSDLRALYEPGSDWAHAHGVAWGTVASDISRAVDNGLASVARDDHRLQPTGKHDHFDRDAALYWAWYGNKVKSIR